MPSGFSESNRKYLNLELHWSTLLAYDIRLVSEGNRRSLRSSFDNMCAVPRTHNSFGEKAKGESNGHVIDDVTQP